MAQGAPRRRRPDPGGGCGFWRRDVVRTIATQCNFGGLWGEELCTRAGVEKTLDIADATDEEYDDLWRVIEDLRTNLLGTFNVLEAARRREEPPPVLFTSTNKVYGDRPNTIPLKELETRWDYDDPDYANGIDETMSLDQSLHSLFGVSKTSADLMVQEYGRYFGMKTCCLRGGCLTGPNHAGVELHGFLSYLIKCNLEEKQYKIFGYKGKQVRDNIHSHDVARFIDEFLQNPKFGEVYNLGGGKENTCSILEAFDLISEISGKDQQYKYLDSNRSGDHICYYSDLSKMKNHYPKWDITISLREIFEQIYMNWKERKVKEST